jgi:hypothetical protein
VICVLIHFSQLEKNNFLSSISFHPPFFSSILTLFKSNKRKEKPILFPNFQTSKLIQIKTQELFSFFLSFFLNLCEYKKLFTYESRYWCGLWICETNKKLKSLFLAIHPWNNKEEKKRKKRERQSNYAERKKKKKKQKKKKTKENISTTKFLNKDWW